MRRYLLAVAVTAVAVAVGTDQALAILGVPQPTQLAITSQVVLTGKVTAVEKDLAEVPAPFAGAKEKQTYKIAVVKIDTVLAGLDGAKLKEVKVGVFKPAPVPPAAPPGGPALAVARGPVAAYDLKEGQELLFFLNKHPQADFYIPAFGAPIDITTAAGKMQLDEVKKVTTILADPMKGLKSDKAEVRAETAAVLVTKYRTAPPFGGETEQVAIGADESKLLLKALAEGEWKAPLRFSGPNAFTAFSSLGLTDKDGWVRPAVAVVPGQPAPDYAAITKDAFTKWLAGPGKDYQIKKIVPKTK